MRCPKLLDQIKVEITDNQRVIIKYGDNAGETANIILISEANTTLTKKGITLSRDGNGFVIFNSKFDTMLPDILLGNGNKNDHFKYANSRVKAMLQENPNLAGEMGLNNTQINFFLNTNNGKAPPDFTWHHHQDTGRMQLVSRKEHQAFVPHTGGMSIWGGGYD